MEDEIEEIQQHNGLIEEMQPQHEAVIISPKLMAPAASIVLPPAMDYPPQVVVALQPQVLPPKPFLNGISHQEFVAQQQQSTVDRPTAVPHSPSVPQKPQFPPPATVGQATTQVGDL